MGVDSGLPMADNEYYVKKVSQRAYMETHMKLYGTGLAIVLTAACILAGCGGGSDTSRARLVAVENRKLTQQIQEKDQRIAQLEAELAQLKKESQEQIESLNASTGAMFEEMILQQQKLEAENEKLKQALKNQP